MCTLNGRVFEVNPDGVASIKELFETDPLIISFVEKRLRNAWKELPLEERTKYDKNFSEQIADYVTSEIEKGSPSGRKFYETGEDIYNESM